MKKLLNISISKILLTCGVGLVITVGGFWHHQMNQSHLSTIHVMNQGLGTCFGRLNQSFTAMMIKDVKSPYLDKGFGTLSGACFEELKSTFKTLENKIPKAREALNKLNSESTWFYEKLGKIHSPMLLGQGMDANLTPIKERYTVIEDLKVSLADELDAGMHRLKEIQFSDEIIMGAGLLLFVLGLGLVSAEELRKLRQRTQAEKMAVNLVKNNQTHVGAMVDSLISKALLDQGLVITAQIFKDYHESILEGMTHKQTIDTDANLLDVQNETITQTEKEILTPLNEVMNVLKTLNFDFDSKEIVEADLKIESEECIQVLSTAIHKLNERRMEDHKVMISSEIMGDRCLINLFLANAVFNTEELEASANPAKRSDPYLMILDEMVKEADISWSYENSIDKRTNQLGMSISFNLPREPKAKNLVSVVKGKKRDLARSLVN